MKTSQGAPTYEACREWALHPWLPRPLGVAHIVRGGIISWVRQLTQPPASSPEGLCSADPPGPVASPLLTQASSHDCGGVSMLAVQPAARHKITARHLSRQAMWYVRQSTLHQVLENRESTARQYALRERALALGWPAERIVVIDQDLGQSGASAADREGFQRLVGSGGAGPRGPGHGPGGLSRSRQLARLAPLVGNLYHDRDVDPR